MKIEFVRKSTPLDALRKLDEMLSVLHLQNLINQEILDYMDLPLKEMESIVVLTHEVDGFIVRFEYLKSIGKISIMTTPIK